MKRTDLAYVAGIVDGEGSISISDKRNKEAKDAKEIAQFTLQVNVKSVDEWLPTWLSFAFGGSVYTYYNQAGNCMWSWTIYANTASEFLKLILPYLHLKRPQAEIAIQYQTVKRERKGKRRTDNQIAVEEAQAILIKSMHNTRKNQTENSNLTI